MQKAAPPAGQAPPLQVRVIAQYIKDLSFENPNVSKLLEDPGDQPNLRIEVNVNASNVGPTERSKARSTSRPRRPTSSARCTIWNSPTAALPVENMPEPQLQPFLLIHCPALLFPFARRLIADLTREGGFPPLLLDPIDFGMLFAKRQQERAQAQAKVN